jgi:hypothetical protein
MPWYSVFGIGRRPAPSFAPTPRTEAFASMQVPKADKRLLPSTDAWQTEAWDFYSSLGEYNYAIRWHSNMMSRVRLRAAELLPGRDEPAFVDQGPAADLLASFAGGVPGQSRLLKNLDVQLQVPGEGYLIGETVKGVEVWQVRSLDEVRVQNGTFQVMDGNGTKDDWRDLAADRLVSRVWNPDERYQHRATSAARSALGTMQELTLVNRHITAQYLSRLASAGIVIFPDEITFPVREEFEESEDPFMEEWLELARAAIKQPGTASAVVPLPIRIPGEHVGKVQHLDFTMKIDDKIIEKRESAIKRLAAQVNIPAEVLLGMGDVNHWGQWQIEEGALKTNIAPDAEMICDQLTTRYLQPRLIASGMPADQAARYVVWYDMSELTLRPDKSDDAIAAYDRLEISGRALRRELGFDEDDLPTDEDLKSQALKVIIKTLPSGAGSALSQLIGEKVEPIVPVSAAPAGAPPDEPAPEPDTQGPPEPASDPSARAQVAASERLARLHRQAGLMHALRIGLGGAWELLHPPVCEPHLYSCPVTHATWTLSSKARPGSVGLYECRTDAFGRPVIGPMVPGLDVSGFLATRSTAGARR